MRNVVIVAAGRSAGGKFGGSLKDLAATDFGATVVREVILRSGISPAIIEQTIFGNAWQAGVGPNPARIVAVEAGVPVDSPAVTVNVRCGSSLQALIMGAQAIKAGDADTVLVGGTENTSQVPYALPKARWGYRMGTGDMVDLMHKDGFACPVGGGLMGELTEALAAKFDISREEQDLFAAQSQNKAEEAVKEARFAEEIVPIEVSGRKGQVTVFKDEEIVREGVTQESLAKLRPVFKKDGTITAGNACALCDGAAALILMEHKKAEDLELRPMALVRGYAFVGCDPKEFGLGPVKAIPRVLEKSGLTLDKIDLIELNEAFALQYLACEKALGLDRSKVNVNGGAIALGHPIAATGAKILTTLLHALKRRNETLGLASLCIGGGHGIAVVVELLD